MAVILLALFLAIVIFLTNEKKRVFILYFGFASFIYFLVFVASPIYVEIIEIYGLGQHGMRFFDKVNPQTLIYVQILALAGYFAMWFGNHIGGRLMAGESCAAARYAGRADARPKTETATLSPIIDERLLFWCGVLLLAGGIPAFVIYANDIGGLVYIYKHSAGLRSGDIANDYAEYGFLKTVATMVFASSFFFFSVLKRGVRSATAKLSKLLFWVTVIASVLILYHISGRLRIFAYVITFPIAGMIIKKKVNWSTIGTISLVAIPVIVFGKQIFHFFLDEMSVERRMTTVSNDPLMIPSLILSEFSFPLETLAHTIDYVVPHVVPYRWFADFVLCFTAVAPLRNYFPGLPPSSNMLNIQALNAPIPIDLVSLGYYSAGAFGVMILLFVFGYVLSWLDNSRNFLSEPSLAPFKASFIIFIGFRVMYADPYNSFKSGFYILSSLLLLWILHYFSATKRRKVPERSEIQHA